MQPKLEDVESYQIRMENGYIFFIHRGYSNAICETITDFTKGWKRVGAQCLAAN